MKSNWQTKKLGDVCDFHNGLWKGKKPPYIEVGVIRNTNFTKDGELDDADIAYLDVEKKQFEKRKLSYGDIVLEKSGGGPKQPVGRVIIFDKKEGNFSFSNFTSVIRIKRKDQIYFKYLHKYLFFSYITGVTETMQSHSTGIRNLDFKLYKEIEIPLPPFPEQHRIVKILDDVFEKIAKAKENAEKNLQNAHELFESYLQSIFTNPRDGWEMKTLSEVANIKGGKRVPKGYRLETQSTNYPYIRVADFNDYGSVDLDNIHYINENVFKQIKNYTISSNDLYISIAGTIGKTGIIPEELESANLTENACKLVFKKNIYSKYVYYFTKTPDFLVQAGLNTRVAAIPKLALRRLSTIKLNIPKSLSEQKRIVARFDALSAETKKLEVIYQQKLNDLEELKKSLLQKVFKGELMGGNYE